MKTHDGRILAMALAGGAPAVLATLYFLFAGDVAAKVQWTVAAVVVVTWVVVPLALRDRVVGRLRALASVLEAFRSGDYTVRTRDHGEASALGDAARELNALGDTLRSHRQGAAEASALLHKVMDAIDVVVLAVDDRGRLELANAAARRWLGLSKPGGQDGDELGDVEALGLGGLLEGPSPRLLTAEEAAEVSDDRRPMVLSRQTFRQGGRPHQLLVLADVGHAVRQKEREAWQKLVRVLGHEINSSLTPIQSIADSLASIARTEDKPADWPQDLEQGLEVIGRRASALARFMAAYTRLAKLPPVSLAEVDVEALVRRNAALEQRVTIEIDDGPALTILGDGDQLDQALINLIKNAAEASLETGGGVRVGWRVEGDRVVVVVDDEGPGVGEASNLFVPFFTTKEGGNGIGLVLARQIAEAHGGTVELGNQPAGRGAQAQLAVPRRPASHRAGRESPSQTSAIGL